MLPEFSFHRPVEAVDAVTRLKAELLDDLGHLLTVDIDKEARLPGHDLLLDIDALTLQIVIDVQLLAKAPNLALDLIKLLVVLAFHAELIAPGKHLLFHHQLGHRSVPLSLSVQKSDYYDNSP